MGKTTSLKIIMMGDVEVRMRRWSVEEESPLC